MEKREAIRRAANLHAAAISLSMNKELCRETAGLREYCREVARAAEAAYLKADLTYIRPIERRLIS